MAQLVEWLLPIPEVRGLNPVIGKKLCIEHLFTVNCIEKTKIKEKEAWNGPFKKIIAFAAFLALIVFSPATNDLFGTILRT